MKIRKITEIIDTILTAKLTDFCGDYAYEILPELGTEYFNEQNISNYTFGDYIRMFPKIVPLSEIAKKKSLTEYSYSRIHELYLDILVSMLLHPINGITDYSGEKVLCTIISGDADFDRTLKPIIFFLMNKINVRRFFRKIRSVYAHNINQMYWLSHGYSILRDFCIRMDIAYIDVLINEEKIEIDRAKAHDIINDDVLQYDTLENMYSYPFCESYSEFALMNEALLFIPFSVAAGLTIPFQI